ncbi:tMP repeat protein [Clostridium sp. CAG:768]|nr:tMP repeat protein [Clostridium sp. CAG:768]
MPKNVGVVLTLKDRFSSKLKDVADKLGTTEKKLQKATMTVQKFSNSLGKGFQNAVSLAGAGIVATVGGMTAFAVKGGEVCDRIDDMSNKIGISRKGFQEWDYLLAQNGGQIESLQMGFKKLVGQINGVTTGNKSAIKNFRALGVSVVGANGKLKSQEQIFNECVNALQKMPAGVKKAQLANDLFGRSGAELMPLLNATTQKLAEQRAEYRRLGLEISDEVIDAGNDFGDALEKWKNISGMFTAMLGTQFMPVLMDLSNYVFDNMPTIKSVVGGAIGQVSNVIKILLDNMDAIIPVASGCVSSIIAFNVISNTIKTIQTLKSVIQAVSTAQGVWNALMLANPIGLVAVAIGVLVGGVALLYNKFEGFRSIVGGVWSVLQLLWSSFVFGAKIVWDKIAPFVKFGATLLSWITPIGLIVRGLIEFCKWVGKAVQLAGGFRGIGSKVKSWADNKKAEINEASAEYDKQQAQQKPSKHALGTPYFQGGNTRINEGGRGEIVNLPSGSQIIPHDIAKSKNKTVNLKVVFDIKGNLIGNRDLFEEFADMLLSKVENKLQTV